MTREDTQRAEHTSLAGPDPGMPRGIDRLLELQDLDLLLGRLQARLDLLGGQEEVRAARQAVADAGSRAGELEIAVDTVAREQSRLEGDVDAFDRKAKDEERRLYDGSVASPKELESIRAEVVSIKGRKSRVEDRLLELMEEREVLEERLASARVEAAVARRGAEELMGSTTTEIAAIEAELDERRAARGALVPAFDHELLALYEELRGTKKGVGAAALRDGVCQGCHEKLSAVELDKLKRTAGIRRCESCRRILVVD